MKYKKKGVEWKINFKPYLDGMNFIFYKITFYKAKFYAYPLDKDKYVK